MNIKISNRLAFVIYVRVRFVFICLFLLFFVGLAFHLPQKMNLSLSSGVFVIPAFILGGGNALFEYLVDPAFFEATIFNGKITLNYFAPRNENRFLVDFLMLSFKKYLKEQTIERQSYNKYKILIDRFGFRKYLVLQKIENGAIYESSRINISFLSAQQYTELILSIDRLHDKVNLN